MRTTIATNAFKRDYKRCKKRKLQLSKLTETVAFLENDQELPAAKRPHKLSGEYSETWECHLAPDWLLIYEFPDDSTLVLRRTGTHSDLFN